MRSFIKILALVGFATLGGAIAPIHAASSDLHFSPCTSGKAKIASLCGSFNVYEDRAKAGGRKIPIGFVILRAEHPSHRAIAWIAGGPGQSATQEAATIADGIFDKYLSVLRDHYDILFVDSRGMGKSNGFGCDFAPLNDPQVYFAQLFPTSSVKSCRAKYDGKRDFNAYDTNNAVDDLDQLRRALGYPKLVLNGGSYGTFFALVYARRHPASVESEILDGVDAPGFSPLLGSPVGAQRAIDNFVAQCSSDTVCKTHFPRFGEHFNAVIHRFDHGPLNVPAKNYATKKMVTVALSKEVLVDRIRQFSYDPEDGSAMPYIIEHAYNGDYKPLAAMVGAISVGLGHGLDLAANLSYTCAENIPFVNEDELKQAAAHSFAGDLRIRAQRYACSLWDVAPMPASFNEAVRSDVPIVMVTGSDDPATPPESAAQALRYLPNAREILVAGGGHGNESPCIDKLLVAFVRAQSAKRLDTSKCSVPRARLHFDLNPTWLFNI